MNPTRDDIPAEASTLAGRLGAKLQIRSITVAGASLRVLVDQLGRAFDEVHVGDWPIEGPAPEGSLLVVDTSILETPGDWDQLRRLLAGMRAGIVVDGKGTRPGAGQLQALSAAARVAGLIVACETLVAPIAAPLATRQSPLLVVHEGDDTRVDDLLSAGIHSLALDPFADAVWPVDRAARVCIASYEVIGPTRNGGIGTANTTLAQALARDGHDVTLLHIAISPPPKGPDPHAEWRAQYAKDGLTYETLPWRPQDGYPASPYPHAARSHDVYRWLLREGAVTPFDIVHFPETLGHGYFSLLAKRTGLAFADTLFVVGVHSPTRWLSEADSYPLASLNQLVEEELERRSVELADVALFPSAYLQQYLLDRGWKLPARCHVQQYILPMTVRERQLRTAAREASTELVYFGRIERRKGVCLFCDALDRLARSAPDAAMRVTFLGRTNLVGESRGDDYVQERARNWPWPVEVVGDLDQPGAIDYLSSRPCVAVMPSLVDNLPNTVIEAVSLGLPFLAAASGGIPEIVAPALHETLLFDPYPTGAGRVLPVPQTHADPLPDPDHLAARLEALVAGSQRTADRPDGLEGADRLAVDAVANERVQSSWHAAARAAGGPEPIGHEPTLAVCVVHRGDESWLQALTDRLVTSADVAPVSFVLVDAAGSSSASPVADIEPTLVARGWTVRHVSMQSGAGAARTIAAEATDADALLFLESGYLPDARFVPAVRRALARSGADVVTVAVGVDGSDEVFVPVGGPAVVGLFHDAFAIGAYAVRRSALDRVGGFGDESADAFVDRDLLNRIKLAGGAIDVIPEPLVTVVDVKRIDELRRRSWDPAAAASSPDSSLGLLRPFRADAGALEDIPTLAYFGTQTGSRALQWRLTDLERQLNAVLASQSWKLTAPIRAVTGAMRRLRR